MGDVKNPIAYDLVFITLVLISISLTLKYKIFESKIVMFSSLVLYSMLIILGTITVAEEQEIIDQGMQITLTILFTCYFMLVQLTIFVV